MPTDTGRDYGDTRPRNGLIGHNCPNGHKKIKTIETFKTIKTVADKGD